MATGSNQTASQEKYNIFNSLVNVPMAMVGWNTIVDLNNNCSVAGTIDDVDGFMNITMVDAVLLDQRLQQHGFSTFFIQARNIRVINIPEKFNVTDEVRKFLDKLDHRHRKPKQNERTFKVKRAKARQQETLRDLAAAEAASQRTSE